MSELIVPSINTVIKEKISISYFGSVLWNAIPVNIGNIEMFEVFKTEIRKWISENYPC